MSSSMTFGVGLPPSHTLDDATSKKSGAGGSRGRGNVQTIEDCKKSEWREMRGRIYTRY